LTVHNKNLCVILSYNAEKTILLFLNRILKIKFKKKIDFILLDDSSLDNSLKIAENFKKDKIFKNLEIISNQNNLGFGGNLKKAYTVAINNNYDNLAILHADGQYPPEYLDLMLDQLEISDFVLGSRMKIKKNALKGNMPILKFVGNIFLTTVQNFIFSINLSEWHTGFRGARVEKLKKIPFDLNSNYFDIDTQVLIQFIIRKFKITEFPIPTYYADEKSGVNLIKYGLFTLYEVVIAKLSILKILKTKRYYINED